MLLNEKGGGKVKKFIILFVLISLMTGAISGIYSRKTTDSPEYPCEVLEVKADEILERCPPEISESFTNKRRVGR